MGKQSRTAKLKQRSVGIVLDKVGVSLSSLCAVHCALMPFIITSLPLLGWEFLADPRLEFAIIFIAIGLGISSLVPSYRKYHRHKFPLVLLFIGFVLMLGTHFLGLHKLEPILMPLGGISIAAAHLMNWKLSERHHGHLKVGA